METKKTIEVWAAEKKTPAWLFAAAKAAEQWAIARELTEEQYLEAIERAGNLRAS